MEVTIRSDSYLDPGVGPGPHTNLENDARLLSVYGTVKSPQRILGNARYPDKWNYLNLGCCPSLETEGLNP